MKKCLSLIIGKMQIKTINEVSVTMATIKKSENKYLA